MLLIVIITLRHAVDLRYAMILRKRYLLFTRDTLPPSQGYFFAISAHMP